MMEILINEKDWAHAQKAKRLSEILCKLKSSGWERFGHCGTIVLFKDIDEGQAKDELNNLKIHEVDAETWEEEQYDFDILRAN